MTSSAPVTRVLVAFALLGAGIVNLGLVRGALPGLLGWLALVLGTAELVAALLTLRGTRPRRVGSRADDVARAAVGVLVAASVLGVALALAGGHVGAAIAAAAALQLAAAGVVGATTRRRGDDPAAPSTSRRPRPATALAMLFTGALVVSTVTTAGLTDTEAGARAVPHSEHHLPDLSGLELHHHGG